MINENPMNYCELNVDKSVGGKKLNGCKLQTQINKGVSGYKSTEVSAG